MIQNLEFQFQSTLSINMAYTKVVALDVIYNFLFYLNYLVTNIYLKILDF